MKKILPYVVLLIFVGSVFQMGFLLNDDVINGHYLTLIGIIVGLIFGVLYFVYRSRQSLKYMNVLLSTDKRPWYHRAPNYPMTFLFSVLGGMTAVTLLNNMPDTGNQRFESFKVTQMGEHRVRYGSIKYLQLSNDSGSITYHPKENQSFSVGQEVDVTIEKGLLGFSRAINADPKSS